MTFKISDNWDDTRTFEQICESAKFSYFFKKRTGELASGDYQYPHLVMSQNEKHLEFTSIECVGGLMVRGDGYAGHGFVFEANKDFEMVVYLDAKECIRDYLTLSNQSEYILN